MYQEAGALLDRLGLPIDPRTKARELSVAQQQVVEIARALSINAKVLIMDEPTSSLTLHEVEELFTIVRQLRDAGTAIVFISHRLEELFALADRVTILRDGTYVGTRAMADVTTDELIRMMVGRTLGELFPKQAVEPGEVVLEVEGLGVEGSFSDVSFQLRRGEILGMAGLIGAGRTNVARALFGTEPATAGTIKLDGKPVTINSPDDGDGAGHRLCARRPQGARAGAGDEHRRQHHPAGAVPLCPAGLARRRAASRQAATAVASSWK